MWAIIVNLVDYLSEHLEKNLNHDISPCDNFYGHICPSTISRNESFDGKLYNLFHSTVDRYYANERKELWEAFEVSASIDNTIRKSNEDQREFVITRCESDPIYKETLMTIFEGLVFLTKKISCESLAKRYVDDLEQISDFINGNKLFTERFFAYQAYLKYWSENSEYSRENTDRIQNLFEVYKEGAMNFAKEHFDIPELASHFENMSKVQLASYFDLPKEKIYKSVEMTASNYDFCYEKLRGSTSIDHKTCISYVKAKIMQELRSNEYLGNSLIESIMDKNPEYFNAVYYTNTNTVVLPPIFYLLNFSDVQQLSSVGFVLGHEVSHAFFSNEFPKKFEGNCLKPHMTRTCENYSESNQKSNKCQLSGATWSEDMADFVAARTTCTFESFQRVIYFQPAPEILQQFFYFYGYIFCSPKSTGYSILQDEHSSELIRINGIASQMPEFRETFKCKESDRMATIQTCFPVHDSPSIHPAISKFFAMC